MVSAETQQKVGAVLKRIQKKVLPPFAAGMEYSFGSDWTGDPAIWIVVNLKDEAEKLPDLGERLADLSLRIRKTVLKKESEAFPYVRYRTLSDKKQELRTTR